jgi:hypothetical protein
MNYSRFSLRQLSKMSDNWYKRCNRLISSWAKEIDPERKKRISCIIKQLEERSRLIREAYYDLKDKLELEKQEADRQLIILNCYNPHCNNFVLNPNGTSLVIMMMNYKPGRKCEFCNEELLTEEDRNIEMMLLDLGINL